MLAPLADKVAVAPTQIAVEETVTRSIKEVKQKNSFENVKETSCEEQFHIIEGSRVVYKNVNEQISIARINGVGGMSPKILEI